MSSPEKVENLSKLSQEELTELYERQSKILKNKKILGELPDKGKQLQKKLEMVKKELQLRKDIGKIEETMETLTLACPNSDVLKEKHIQHICSIERSPKTERYKPCGTFIHKDEQPTKLITLAESITLLAEQINKIPVGNIRKHVERTGGLNDNEENLEDSSDDSKDYSEGESE